LARLFQPSHIKELLLEHEPNERTNHWGKDFAALESHCFRGPLGFRKFAELAGINIQPKAGSCIEDALSNKQNNAYGAHLPSLLPDLLHQVKDDIIQKEIPTSPQNLWVIKDSNANGVGGIWVVDESNAHEFLSPTASALIEEHRYVAQRYVWPPILFGGRKCHVRVYALLTAEGKAFVHRRAFLHVANEEFSMHSTAIDSSGNEVSQPQQVEFDPSVHITNCCANSDDEEKFTGEICADLTVKQPARMTMDNSTNVSRTNDIPLGDFLPSISASLAILAQTMSPFIHGGEVNGGFEYMGLDFILSYKQQENCEHPKPVAYLLEVNAPPSQDTATGLAHAEDLHNDVLNDLVQMWVIPKVEGYREPIVENGWKCVSDPCQDVANAVDAVPSKASILNKMRWAIFERKACRADERNVKNSTVNTQHPYVTEDDITIFARSQYPYFTEDTKNNHNEGECKSTQIYFENAGGAQVPFSVIKSMIDSLSHRHRSLIGTQLKYDARKVLMKILGASDDNYVMFLGQNATSLFQLLAWKYSSSDFLSEGDEIVIAEENHLANVDPWLKLAEIRKMKVKWWSCAKKKSELDSGNGILSTDLLQLVTARTKIISISHSSNILGMVIDIKRICTEVKKKHPKLHVIVDGVASVPHHPAQLSYSEADWYVVSGHKLFGPHLGGLCGKKLSINDIICHENENDDAFYRQWESGTQNYEGCAGLKGLGLYFSSLASFSRGDGSKMPNFRSDTMLKVPSHHDGPTTGEDPIQQRFSNILSHIPLDAEIKEAYRRIKKVEDQTSAFLLKKLNSNSKVRIIKNIASRKKWTGKGMLLPIISFVHKTLSSEAIVKWCWNHDIIIRSSTFLSTDQFMSHFGEIRKYGRDTFVRISLCHYNNLQEVQTLIEVLGAMEGFTS
jgi:selenocysteine lyase/cysteine desulfurase